MVMLRDSVGEKLQETFGSAVHINSASHDFAVFPAKHPSVGEVTIREDDNELIVSLGDITHGHFGSYVVGLTETEHAAVISQVLINFLQDLFADRYLLFKATWGGGWTLRDNVSDEKLRSSHRQWFRWSGPIDFSQGL
jgi:hypothetical protein